MFSFLTTGQDKVRAALAAFVAISWSIVVIMSCAYAIQHESDYELIDDTTDTNTEITVKPSCTAGVVSATSDMIAQAEYESRLLALEADEENTDEHEDVYLDGSTIISRKESSNIPVAAKSWNFTYEPVRLITCESAPSYIETHAEGVTVDEESGILMKDGKYMVAIGTGYGFECGKAITLFMEDGQMIDCYIGDIKADCDTDPSNKYQKYDGSVIEFIINDSYKYNQPDWSKQCIVYIDEFID